MCIWIQFWEQNLYNCPTVLGSHEETGDRHSEAYCHILIFEGICFLLFSSLLETSKPYEFISRDVKSTLITEPLHQGEEGLISFFPRCWETSVSPFFSFWRSLLFP